MNKPKVTSDTHNNSLGDMKERHKNLAAQAQQNVAGGARYKKKVVEEALKKANTKVNNKLKEKKSASGTTATGSKPDPIDLEPVMKSFLGTQNT